MISTLARRDYLHAIFKKQTDISLFIESGFDILNPVQCSAVGMEPEKLKEKYGRELVFWGGGVDIQRVLPFGRPEEVREQVMKK